MQQKPLPRPRKRGATSKTRTHTMGHDYQFLPPLSPHSGPGLYSVPPIDSWVLLPKWIEQLFREELIKGNMPTHLLQGRSIDWWVRRIDTRIVEERRAPRTQPIRRALESLRISLRALPAAALRRLGISYLPNVKDQPRLCLARHVRQHGA